MAIVGVVSRLLVAVVFAVAGLSKLRDRAGTRQTLVEFGTPKTLAVPLAIVLPLSELAVAALLVPAPTAPYGTIAALVLLGIFSAAIGWNLARGRTPSCHCFGQLHSAPAGWRTLGRNAVLALVALIALVSAVAKPDASAVAWIGDLAGAELLAFVVALAAAAVFVLSVLAFMSLMRSYGQVLTRLDRVEAALANAGLELEGELEMPEIGLEPGTPAPAFSASTVRGGVISLETITASGRPSLLVFTSPRCGPCRTLLPTVADWQREYAESLTVVVAIDATVEEALAEADEYGLDTVLVDEGGSVYEVFQGNGTPSAVLIGADGTVASWLAAGSEWIEQLVRQMHATRHGEEQGLPLGTNAPALELRSLEGETVALASLRGRDTLLLFWNPECGFCRSMHNDLLAWEASTNGEHPRLVVVSSGDEESTRAEGFGSLVLLDEQFATGSAFEANGTPMAVLLDAEGRIASDTVAGADAVLELAHRLGTARADSL